MKEEELKDVSDFLILNGFVKTEPRCYANDYCGVEFQDNGYCVCNNNGEEIFSSDWNIYWLIGVLTYYDYIPKNYKTLNHDSLRTN